MSVAELEASFMAAATDHPSVQSSGISLVPSSSAVTTAAPAMSPSVMALLGLKAPPGAAPMPSTAAAAPGLPGAAVTAAPAEAAATTSRLLLATTEVVGGAAAAEPGDDFR